jgi:Fe2+ or Zn2+ uptake regulation protein
MSAFITIKQQLVLDFVQQRGDVYTSEVAQLTEVLKGLMFESTYAIGRSAAYGRLRALERKGLVQGLAMADQIVWSTR